MFYLGDGQFNVFKNVAFMGPNHSFMARNHSSRAPNRSFVD